MEAELVLIGATAIEDKLQLLIDLLVLVCKKLHRIEGTGEITKYERHTMCETVSPDESPELCPTTAVTGWMRDFKSESSVDEMQKKYT